MSEMKLIATGPFSLDKYDTLVGANGRTVVMTGVALAGGNDWGDVPLENTKLLLEALSVHHETGMTPRELVERCSAMEAALQHCQQMLLSYSINRVNHEEIEDAALMLIRAALAKHKEV